jgi:N-acetylglucosamine-6-phosphate deacetylase
MLISKVRYFGEDFRFHYGDICVEDGRFTEVAERDGEAPDDTDTVIPGLVDIHIHGNSGVDISDTDYEGLTAIARYLAAAGTTSFSAASMTMPVEALEKAYINAARLHHEAPDGCATLCGITMEGPFFCEARKGSHEARHLRLPDAGMLMRLQQAADGLIKITCVAPELPGALGYIRAAHDLGIVVAAAHTSAGYDEAVTGFEAGATHLTHLFNAMPPLLHRDPGVIGAAAERPNVTVELIGDGIHVHPSAVRAAFKLFGPERICLISDAIPAAGLPEGSISTLGGQRVYTKNGCASLADGTIAGSVVTLLDCVRRMTAMGIPAEHVLRCATANPARVLDADDIGVIAVGKRANFLISDAEWELKRTFISGAACSDQPDKLL